MNTWPTGPNSLCVSDSWESHFCDNACRVLASKIWALITALGGLAGSEHHVKSWSVERRAFLLRWSRVQAVPSQILSTPSYFCYSVFLQATTILLSRILEFWSLSLMCDWRCHLRKLHFESGVVVKRGCPSCSLAHRRNTAQDQAQRALWRGPAGAPTPTDMQPRMSEERTVLLLGVSRRARPGWQGLHSSREQREVPAAVREPACLAFTQTGPGRAVAARLRLQTPPLRWAHSTNPLAKTFSSFTETKCKTRSG